MANLSYSRFGELYAYSPSGKTPEELRSEIIGKRPVRMNATARILGSVAARELRRVDYDG